MFYGYHGLYPEENKLGQRFNVDLELRADLMMPGKTDDMEDSIHYGAAYEVVKKIVEGEPKNLLEALADDIAEAMFQRFEQLESIKVHVDKPGPPIPGYYDSVAIEIVRERHDYD